MGKNYRHLLLNTEPTFSPSRLFANGEQGVWYDPSDFSTMFQDSAGTTPVTAIEQPVGLILDKSGRGNHASQSTTTSRPILKQDETGRYYLFFDGADDSLSVPNSKGLFKYLNNSNFFSVCGIAFGDSSNPNAAYSVYGTCFLTASVGAFLFYDDRPIVSRNNRIISLSSREASPNTYFNDAGDNSILPNIANVVTHYGNAASATASSRSIIRVNAGSSYANNTSTSTPSSADSTFYFTIGQSGDPAHAYPMLGRLYSLIVRGALTSSPQLEQTEKWVAAKTGVTL